MEVLARFNGVHGEISIIEEISTGARVYHEAGVYQSYVFPGGRAGLSYVRLMRSLLLKGSNALLLGCGGGTLGSELHRNGSAVIIVDNNPISFHIARNFFWMPASISCVLDDMTRYLSKTSEVFDVIGVDVGGPCFDYDEVLNSRTCALLRRRLAIGGEIAINIACEWEDDPIPDRIADRFVAADTDVWIFEQRVSIGHNVVIFASSRQHDLHGLRKLGRSEWIVRKKLE